MWRRSSTPRKLILTRSSVSRLAHLDRLPVLIRLLAANNAGELVKARIATDSGIPETSVTSYVDLLQTLYLIHQVPAWGNNLIGRVTWAVSFPCTHRHRG